MVFELLGTGSRNAKTGKELARMLDCNIRQVTEQIERERRAGKPICASMNGMQGYYLAETQEDLQQYCAAIKRRAVELFKTRQALISILKQLPGAENEEH